MEILNFKSESLVVDYISFNFQTLDDSQQRKLAKPIKEDIIVNFENQFDVCFVKETAYWHGTILQFSGDNANKFYSLIQQ